jgi:two-component system LytT family response regulator
MARYAGLFQELGYVPAKNKLFVHLKTAVEPIELDEIIYLESNSNYTHIYLTSGNRIVASRNLRDFENHLRSEQNFMRVHNSFIINIRKVLRYLKSEEQIIMINNKQIPLSKSKRNSFFSWLNP